MIELKYDKYLVTGGAGFIGSHICEEIAKQGKQFVCIDNLVAGKRENLLPWWSNNRCQFVKADITGLDEILPYFDGVDVVFHNAASKCTVCREDPQRDLMSNAWGSWCVFEAARRQGVKKVVHASTGSVNGGNPKSFYGVSKMAGEAYLRAFAEYYPKFNFTSIRYHHVYGPRQNSDNKGGVIPIFIKGLLNGGNIKIFGDGKQRRHFTYVKDVVGANFLAESKWDRKFIDFAEKGSTEINALAVVLTRAIRGTTGEANIERLPARRGDIKTFSFGDHVTPKRLGKESDYSTRLFEGIEETINWYVENGFT